MFQIDSVPRIQQQMLRQVSLITPATCLVLQDNDFWKQCSSCCVPDDKPPDRIHVPQQLPCLLMTWVHISLATGRPSKVCIKQLRSVKFWKHRATKMSIYRVIYKLPTYHYSSLKVFSCCNRINAEVLLLGLDCIMDPKSWSVFMKTDWLEHQVRGRGQHVGCRLELSTAGA